MKHKPQPRMIDRVCKCGQTFQARSADVKRGWGKFCSKSCKAKEQERRTGASAEYHRQRNWAQEQDGL